MSKTDVFFVISVMVAGLSCSGADAADTDGGACPGGGECALTDQMCPTGQVVGGIDSDGALICVAQAGARQQSCSGRQVVSGIRVDGSIICTEPFEATSCDSGQLLAGIGADGSPTCVGIDSMVRDYVNSRCYLYVGWRDSCDGCIDLPTKTGRVRGDAMDCTTGGADGSCATFDLFGQMVQMAGISTDGDVNDDDKFWVGLKCE